MRHDGIGDDLCVLLTPREVGGHERALAGWLADAVRQHGLRPRVVAPSLALRQCFMQAGLGPSLATPAAGWPSVVGALVASARRQPLLLAPGSLHAHPALLAAALTTRRPIWVYVPNTHSARTMGARLAGLRDAVITPLLRSVANWIVLTDDQARHLREAWQCRDARIEVLPNLARLPEAGPSLPAPAEDGRLRVTFVGRLDLHSKGLDWLCDTLLARVEWARTHRWRFQGDGPGRSRLQQLADRLGPDCVELVPHGPIDAAFAASDLLLLASRFEGRPLVALEALQRGWPVVASAQSGLQDLLPGEAQFAFGDAAGLAQALQHMACANRRQACVNHARRRQGAAQVKARYQLALVRLSAGWQNRPAPQSRGAAQAGWP